MSEQVKSKMDHQSMTDHYSRVGTQTNFGRSLWGSSISLAIATTVISLLPLSSVAFAKEIAPKEQIFADSGYGDGYIGLFHKMGTIAKSPSSYLGIQGTWKVHQYLHLGLGGYGLANRYRLATPSRETLNFSYLGFVAESRIYTWRFLSLAAGTLVGMGNAGYRVDAVGESAAADEASGVVATAPAESQYFSDGFGVYEPYLNLLVHLNQRADISLGWASRVTQGFALEGMGQKELDGHHFTVGLLGNF